jgi:hypothetical protein
MLVLLEEEGSPVACTVRPWDRVLIHLRALGLDHDLAAGASPEASFALALRAQMLVRTRHRRDLAAAADRVLAMAVQASAPARPRVPVCKDRVRDCWQEFEDLIRRLRAPGPVPAQGMAKVGMLLTDAGGPLYHRGSAGDLRAQVRDAVDTLTAA